MSSNTQTPSWSGPGAGDSVTCSESQRDQSIEQPPNAQSVAPRSSSRTFPALLRFPRLRDHRLSIDLIWMELAEWLCVPWAPFEKVAQELIGKWEEFFAAHELEIENDNTVDFSEWLKPTEKVQLCSHWPSHCAGSIELFLHRVEDDLRASGQEPPHLFWQLSVELAVFAAEMHARGFECTIRERQEQHNAVDGENFRPCFEPDALAASWRREDPRVVKRLLLQAEADASTSGYQLPPSVYRLAINHALAITRREEAWESFYANHED